MNSFGVFFFIGIIVTTAAVFKEYCTPGLCVYNGGDGMHTGCRDNIPHNGQLQASCPKDAYLIDVDKFHRKLIIDFHNEHREIVASGGLIPDGISSACRIGKVKWNEELKLTAELHAKTCIFAHDRCRNTLNYPLSGQNLGINTYADGAKLNITEKVLKFLNGWYLEYKVVTQSLIDKFAANPDKKAPMTGHFLTMINERGNRMGCSGVHFRHSATKLSMMLSCTYSSTSIGGSAIFNSCKTPGSKCTSGRDIKYRNLCSSKEVYDYNGLLQLIPYDTSSVIVNEDYVDDEEEEDEDGAKDEGGAAKPSSGGDSVPVPGGGAKDEGGAAKPSGGAKDEGGAAKPSGGGDSVPVPGGGAKDEGGAAKPSGGGDSVPVPGYRKTGRREGRSGGRREGVHVVGVNDADYFDYRMGPYPGFSSTLSQSQRINQHVLTFAIIFTGIYHIIWKN